ncbi:hypothetical protein WN51_14542 [Melipona quadrifasciata]|uniref:Uncharacterized protein n=1 Tax=Melipona quadrifasciata TaxID=166423 RepID=A0A0M9A3I9_9HYME|nr:hypothetical protein WN51_14542 [Melipona quadrifasciata]
MAADVDDDGAIPCKSTMVFEERSNLFRIRHLFAVIYGHEFAGSKQDVYNLLGETLSRLQQYAEAERWFQASLASQPDHVPAHITYGKLLARNSSRVLEAERWFLRARRLAPDDSSVHHHYEKFAMTWSNDRPIEGSSIRFSANSRPSQFTISVPNSTSVSIHRHKIKTMQKIVTSFLAIILLTNDDSQTEICTNTGRDATTPGQNREIDDSVFASNCQINNPARKAWKLEANSPEGKTLTVARHRCAVYIAVVYKFETVSCVASQDCS